MYVNTQGDDSNLQAKERGIRRINPCNTFGYRLSATGIVRKYISVANYGLY